MDQTPKTCSRCKLEKKRSDFYKRSSSRDGFDSWCKDCTKKSVTAYQNMEEYKQNKKEYDKEYRSQTVMKRREYHKDYRTKNYDTIRKQQESLEGRFSAYKSRAKTKKINFSLSLQQFEELTCDKCYYCNEFSQDKEFVGIDRAGPERGYTPENCLPCCNVCNIMKNTLSQSRFIEQVKKVYRIMVEGRL